MLHPILSQKFHQNPFVTFSDILQKNTHINTQNATKTYTSLAVTTEYTLHKFTVNILNVTKNTTKNMFV